MPRAQYMYLHVPKVIVEVINVNIAEWHIKMPFDYGVDCPWDAPHRARAVQEIEASLSKLHKLSC